MLTRLKGQLSISRATSNYDNPRPIRISLVDQISRVSVAEIEISLADFAECLTGLGHVPCEFEYLPNAPVGKTLQVKTEIVQMPFGLYETEARKRAAVEAMAPFEVDGWKGHMEDALNHHRSTGMDKYRVSFSRHVDQEAPDAKD